MNTGIPNIGLPSSRPHRRRPFLTAVIILVAVLITALLASLGISFYVGWQSTHPIRVPIVGTPSDVGLEFQNIQFPSRVDKLQLQGWLIPAASQTGNIVIEAHGYKGNRSKDEPALPMAKALHDAGFAVMMFDFRDEGTSPGDSVSIGYMEERDLLGAVDYAKSLGYKHVGLLGFSMGASTALEATAHNPDVTATVADSPFANLYNYLVTNMPVWTHLPNWPFTPEILWEMRVLRGVDAARVNPLGDLKVWQPRPLLLIAGTADDTIPMSNSQSLYNEVKANPDDSLWIVAGAKHVGAYKVSPKDYEAKVTQFFLQYMRG